MNNSTYKDFNLTGLLQYNQFENGERLSLSRRMVKISQLDENAVPL